MRTAITNLSLLLCLSACAQSPVCPPRPVLPARLLEPAPRPKLPPLVKQLRTTREVTLTVSPPSTPPKPR